MRFLRWLALALAPLVLWASPAAAQYVVRDGNGASRTFCSFVVLDVHYGCQVLHGLNSGAPQALALDGSGRPTVLQGGAWTVDLGDLNGAATDTKLDELIAAIGVQHAEDAAHTTGDSGTLALAVRRDAAAAGSGADGDYSTLNVDADGLLWVRLGAPLPSGANTIGTVNLGSLAGASTAANQATMITHLSAMDTALAAIAGDSSPVETMGDVAHDAADSGSPLKVGGKAATADRAAVANGDRVDGLYDALGKAVTIPALRGQKGRQFTTITSSASETTIVTAAGSGVFADLYGLVIANTSGSDGSCTIKDATAGSTVMVVAVKAGQTAGFALEAGSAITQAAANNNWTATCTSLASWNITATFVKTAA